jgi:3D (Asp-Asp-Asp) domain-containing protein
MTGRIPTLALLAILAACSGDSKSGGGGGTTSSFAGIISSTDGTASGSVELTIEAASLSSPAPTGPALSSPVNVTGSLKFSGVASVGLSGTYETTTKAVTVTGGGYALDGAFDGIDRLEGTYTGPAGASGTFVTTKSTQAAAFCGTYAANDQSDAGTFSFVITGTKVRGNAVSSVDQTLIPLDGAISGNNITIYFPGTQVALATGTRSGSNVSGTFDDQQGTAGTWAGSTCQ